MEPVSSPSSAVEMQATDASPSLEVLADEDVVASAECSGFGQVLSENKIHYTKYDHSHISQHMKDALDDMVVGPVVIMKETPLLDHFNCLRISGKSDGPTMSIVMPDNEGYSLYNIDDKDMDGASELLLKNYSNPAAIYAMVKSLDSFDGIKKTVADAGLSSYWTEETESCFGDIHYTRFLGSVVQWATEADHVIFRVIKGISSGAELAIDMLRRVSFIDDKDIPAPADFARILHTPISLSGTFSIAKCPSFPDQLILDFDIMIGIPHIAAMIAYIVAPGPGQNTDILAIEDQEILDHTVRQMATGTIPLLKFPVEMEDQVESKIDGVVCTAEGTSVLFDYKGDQYPLRGDLTDFIGSMISKLDIE